MSKSERKLAAILFADIVGYSALMQNDEPTARQLLDKFHFTIQTEVEDQNGKVINNYGDGCVCTFSSAVDAMRCAMEIQKAFRDGYEVPVRIGVHSGDVFFEKDNVFGDSVNIASRIESLGVAGAILFSERIKKDITNQTQFKVHALGDFEFKNIEKKMKVFALANDGLAIPKPSEMKGKLKSKAKTRWQIPALILGMLTLVATGVFWLSNNRTTSTTLNEIPSIAVLPFDDLSVEKDQAYFADGIAEEILNTLAKLKELKVAGRTSSFSFRGKEATIKQIGEALNVNHVLEGSVRKQGDKIRVTAQLIKVADGFHVWSEKYDSDFDDLFAIQDSLAQGIGKVLLEKLAPKQIEKLKTNLPRNSKAYDLFLRGKYIHWNVYRTGASDQKDFDKSEQLFLEAIEIDSTYALAHAGLADLYDTHVFNLKRKGDESGALNYSTLSQKASELAFRLNPELSYVNTVRGYVVVNQGEFREAFNCFLKAAQINPNNPEAVYGLQYFYRRAGLFYDAIKIGNRLKETDPLFEAGLTETLALNFRIGKYQQVNNEGEYILDLNKDNVLTLTQLFFNSFHANKKEEALAIIEKINEIDPTYATKYLPSLEFALLNNDETFIAKMRKEGDRYEKFTIHNFYGEDDQAEEELKLKFEEKSKELKNTALRIQDADYLYYSKNKQFEKYQSKDWFQKAIEPQKKIYEYVLAQFPRAEEVLEQLDE